MRDIERLKTGYLDKLANKYYGEPSQNLCGDSFYRCSILAEMWAYMKVILPKDVSKYTIFDFDGRNKKGEVLIKNDIAINAKNSISKYCWGKTWEQITNRFEGDNKKIREFMNKNSTMMERLHKGNNIIIHGESIGHPIGRTMVASIIMKEAIKLRAQNGQRGQSYEWIDFVALKSVIVKDSLTKNSDVSANYKSCSWLVVDNIFQPNYSSIQQREYMSEVIDIFFINRLNDNLPTIFVFKFDIRKTSFSAEEEMGTGISRIIHNRATCKIPLCEEFKV